MKKLVMGLLLLVALMPGIVSVSVGIDVETLGSRSSCNSAESKDTYLYLKWDNGVTLYPDDTFWS